ncbi:MAG: hypothetical protein ACKO37_05435, partial [Vampirovibrionales bacterium]
LKRVHPELGTQSLEAMLIPYWQFYLDSLTRLVQQTHTPDALQQGICLRHTPLSEALAQQTFITPEAWLKVWLPVVREARYLSMLRYSAFSPIMQQFNQKGRVIDTPYYQLYHQVMPRLLLLLAYNSHFKTLGMFQTFQEGVATPNGSDPKALHPEAAIALLAQWQKEHPQVLSGLETAWFKALKQTRLKDHQEEALRDTLIAPWVTYETTLPQEDLQTLLASPSARWKFNTWQLKASYGLYILFERTTFKPNRGYLQTLMK